MVDKALFIDSSAANVSMRQLEILTNNLANVGTVGFRADHESYKSIPVSEQKNNSRVYTSIDKTYSNFTPGSITSTGRDLDMAINGNGFIAVQNKNGQEGYTRAGDLRIVNNFLATQSGELVKGINGVISVPNGAQRIFISNDATVSAQLPGQEDLVTVGQIKLTNPPVSQLQKGTDGYFYLSDGASAKYDPKVKVTPGALESSNVNAVQTLTQLIELSRRFEFHSNFMKNFSDISTKANQILNLT